MPFYVVNGLRVHINMGRRKAAPACRAIVERKGIKCHCQGISSMLCDWPVEGGACSMPLCPEHATEVGRDRHYCPRHLLQHREAEPELF